MISFEQKKYAFALIAVSIIAIILSLHWLSILWTFKSDLVEVKSKLRDTYLNVSGVTDRRGHHSMFSELSIFLVGKNQKYSISENIGEAYVNEGYQRIIKCLERADSVSVWIRKKETSEYAPKVFQINADGKVLLAFETVRKENRRVSLVLLLIGTASLIFLFWFFLPASLRCIFRL